MANNTRTLKFDDHSKGLRRWQQFFDGRQGCALHVPTPAGYGDLDEVQRLGPEPIEIDMPDEIGKAWDSAMAEIRSRKMSGKDQEAIIRAKLDAASAAMTK